MARLVVTAAAPRAWAHGYRDGVVRRVLEVRDGAEARPEWFTPQELESFLSRGWLAWLPTPSAPQEAEPVVVSGGHSSPPQSTEAGPDQPAAQPLPQPITEAPLTSKRSGVVITRRARGTGKEHA